MILKCIDMYRYVFEYIRDTKCAIIVFNHPDSGYLAEGLHDVGLRKGDVVIIGSGNLYYSLLEDIDEKYMKKRREILSGVLCSTPSEYEGELGNILMQEFKKKFHIVMTMGLTYDSFATIANLVKYTIIKGEDYENPEILMKTMRTQRFIGCTGDVNFLVSQNSRIRSWASMIQIIVDQNSKSFDLLDFGKFDKFSLVVYKIYSRPHWNTKDGLAQTNYRTSNKCVYDNNN